jgi:ABC-2 type transport system permease protein
VAVSAATSAAMSCTSSAACHPDITELSLTGTDVGQAVVAMIAVLAVTGEYATGMIRATLAAVPRRSLVLAAKAVVVTALALASGALAAGALAVTSPGWHRHLQQIAPMTAGLEIQASTGLSTLPISPWAGLGVLAAWAAAALLAGGLLLRFRDA